MNDILASRREYLQAASPARGLIAYLLIAFGVAWAAWIPLGLLGIPTNSQLYEAGVMVGLFAPALGTIIVRQWVTREGFRDAGLQPNLRQSWPYYLFAWLWPLLAFGALTVAALVGLPILRDVSADIPPALLSALIMTLPLWGEEFGWRGYLQLRLFGGRPLLGALATGAIWGVWHYPVVLSGYLPNQHGILGLAVFPAYTILFSIILGWLRLRTRSVWAPCLAHASNNMVLAAIGAALFATPVGNGDLFLDPRGLVALLPMGILCTWIIVSGQLAPEGPGAQIVRSPVWHRV